MQLSRTSPQSNTCPICPINKWLYHVNHSKYTVSGIWSHVSLIFTPLKYSPAIFICRPGRKYWSRALIILSDGQRYELTSQNNEMSSPLYNGSQSVSPFVMCLTKYNTSLTPNSAAKITWLHSVQNTFPLCLDWFWLGIFQPIQCRLKMPIK